MSALSYTFACCLLILYFLYYLSCRKFNYWKKKNVPYLKPLPFFGNFKDFIIHKTYYPVISREICRQFPNAPYVGAFYGTEPTLIVMDPELIKLVLVKDFYYFNGREISEHTHREVAGNNLFFTYGDRWKIIRQNLTPLFSSGKMKNMFPLIEKCGKSLDSWVTEEICISSVIDIRKMMANYTMDCIGSCILGVNADTLSRSTEINPFQVMGDKIFEPNFLSGLKNVWRPIWPAIFYGLGLKYIDDSVINFFNKLLLNVFASRQHQPTQRHDFIDLLIGLKNNKYVSGDCIANTKTGANDKIQLEVNDDFLVSNCILLFAAGFETSASTLSYALYELAKNQEAQAKAISEVDVYCLRHATVEFDCVTELPYLYACIEETLRLYPILGVLTREVMEDYTLPTGLHLDKGLRVHIPAYYLHLNPDYFPEPEQYRPERFYGETKSNTAPYTFLPFGEGPRNCIGMRFAKMQVLAGLLTILRKYRVELAEGMPSFLPFEAKTLTSQPKGKILLKFIRHDVH